MFYTSVIADDGGENEAGPTSGNHNLSFESWENQRQYPGKALWDVYKRQMKAAAETVVGGRPFACDIGAFNDDTFVYIAAFGLFTDVSYETKQEYKNVLGHMAYILEGMKRLPLTIQHKILF